MTHIVFIHGYPRPQLTANPTGTLTTGAWTRFTLVVDTTSVSVFTTAGGTTPIATGVIPASSTAAGAWFDGSQYFNGLFLGRSFVDQGGFFTGAIADFQVYNVALSGAFPREERGGQEETPTRGSSADVPPRITTCSRIPVMFAS